ncbi:isochorismatase family protein [Neisseriaceae bacterium PsAf]|nr:isochorismatase family protein [Neisseriaceae bacterium PsAf]MCV2502869.1 isochorismatase family protein [Neisseriaceae bacterium]
MTIVAIDVDAQKGFSPLCPDELPVEDALSIVPELNYQARFSDFRVLTKDAHSPNAVWMVSSPEEMLQPLPYENADLTWVSHCLVGSEGFETLPGLPMSNQYDFIVYKGLENDMHPYGACYHDLGEKISTGLLEWLSGKEANILLVGGLATDYCVKNTVLQLLEYSKKWKVIVNLAACRGIATETIESAITEMKIAGAILIKKKEELHEFLK